MNENHIFYIGLESTVDSIGHGSVEVQDFMCEILRESKLAPFLKDFQSQPKTMDLDGFVVGLFFYLVP